MKKAFVSVITISIGVLILAGILAFGNGNKELPVETVSYNTVRSCYVYHQVATKSAPYAVDETIDITIDGTNVKGSKQGTQNGPDMTNGYMGTIQGTTDTRMITAVYAYTIEGSQNSEQEFYKIVPGGLEKLRYPLIEQGGILVPDTTKDFKTMLYTTVDCSK